MRVSRQTVTAIRGALERSGRTIPWLAEESGIPYPTLHRKLTSPNAKALDLDELEAIAAALDVPASKLTAVA